MPRHPSKTLTDGELRIMDVVWTLGEASVRDVTERLSQHDTVAYNTVLTMLGILKDKGYVRHRKSGRAFLYRPLVSRETAQRSALKTPGGAVFLRLADRDGAKPAGQRRGGRHGDRPTPPARGRRRGS